MSGPTLAWAPDRPRCLVAVSNIEGRRIEAVVVSLGARCFLWFVYDLDGAGRRKSLVSGDVDELEKGQHECERAIVRRVRQLGPQLAKGGA